MAVSRLSARGQQSTNPDCEIIVSEPEGRVTCIDAPTGTIIGSRLIPRDSHGDRQTLDPDGVIRMVGVAYPLASIAVDIETDLLGRRTRRVAAARTLVAPLEPICRSATPLSMLLGLDLRIQNLMGAVFAGVGQSRRVPWRPRCSCG